MGIYLNPNNTEFYNAVEHSKIYVDKTELIAGERKRIDTTTFTNDMVTFEIQDDVLTLLIHLGYLGYDFNSKEILYLLA